MIDRITRVNLREYTRYERLSSHFSDPTRARFILHSSTYLQNQTAILVFPDENLAAVMAHEAWARIRLLGEEEFRSEHIDDGSQRIESASALRNRLITGAFSQKNASQIEANAFFWERKEAYLRVREIDGPEFKPTQWPFKRNYQVQCIIDRYSSLLTKSSPLGHEILLSDLVYLALFEGSRAAREVLDAIGVEIGSFSSPFIDMDRARELDLAKLPIEASNLARLFYISGLWNDFPEEDITYTKTNGLLLHWALIACRFNLPQEEADRLKASIKSCFVLDTQPGYDCKGLIYSRPTSAVAVDTHFRPRKDVTPPFVPMALLINNINAMINAIEQLMQVVDGFRITQDDKLQNAQQRFLARVLKRELEPLLAARGAVH